MYRYDDFSAHAQDFEQLKNKIAWRVALPQKLWPWDLHYQVVIQKSESP